MVADKIIVVLSAEESMGRRQGVGLLAIRGINREGMRWREGGRKEKGRGY
jgi:hypothetical protein